MVDELTTTIYEKLSVLQGLMRRQEMSSQVRFGPFADTSRGQGRILAMLRIQPEIATKDLAYLLGIRQQSLNELLNKLEKGGYVERRSSETDRRVMVVHLTEKGKTVQQPMSNHEAVLGCLSQEELRQFGSYLDRIIAAFRAQEGGDETAMKDWMEKAKERMGEEQFEQLLSMRERAFGSFRRGKRPADIPGAERFSPDYDGPVPDRSEFGRFGTKERK